MNIQDMVGKTFTAVNRNDNYGYDGETLTFECEEGTFIFYHAQNCCESVGIHEIVGDLNDLVGEPLLRAEESCNYDEPKPEYADSFLWSFYKFATIKGEVVVTWLGESNGYYSESVDLRFDKKGNS